ncbi:YceI family protein [Sporolactobacillus sp. Y61]|jgi:polyisoprenoid-binding protein YceI|uniref:YceI family protein n=1 Tax=Sporolactobacillus sp. Y61 TaxID=3160863 RepID=A0AAU8IGA2_9BACL|nr:YceI family protein [Sporolactobacillus sp. THM19-2]RYL87548.1 polyisoprenoid-binding protein [Sporolactobacillus sp. THM19-2]
MSEWTIDTAHTETSFSVKHMGLSNVRGNFEVTTGTVTTDNSGKITAIDAKVDVASIDTRNADRDNHLKSADFFEAEKFPEIRFVSTSITSKDEDEYTITGDLSIKGITKSVTFDAEVGTPIDDPYGLKRSGAGLSFSIDRRDFGLTWSQALANGSLVVGNKIKINIDAEITQNPAA